MKNFRKVLALVLVLATLFSLASVAGAALTFDYLESKDLPEAETPYYEDEASINYLEAVRLLSFCGILNGYEDGTFQAANNIRRNEMAKMIAVLANAGYDVEDLYATAANFNDVPATDWAASYVAYCAKTGIVAGRSATTFDPNASVTGLETAKMLLVVLGFNAEEQGYVGADWKVNVLRDAKVMGLLNNFDKDYNVEDAISRDEAANMMMNALAAPVVVGFLSDDVITITNALISKWTSVPSLSILDNATLKDAVEAGEASLYGNVIISDTVLAGVLYGIAVKYNSTDCYGRPVVEWSYKGETLVQVPYVAAFSSYDTDADEVIEFAYDYRKDYDFMVSVDGAAKAPSTNKPSKLSAAQIETLLKGLTYGKGVVVEIYVLEDAKEVYVAVINTYIAQVTDINMAKDTVTFGGDAGNITGAVDNEWGFTAADKNETTVLLWKCGDKDGVHTVKVIEPVTAVVTRIDKDGKGNYSFIADGETFEYAENYGVHMDPAGKLNIWNNFQKYGETAHDIFVDEYGYVMWAKQADNENKEIVVVDGDSWISKGAYETADGTKYESHTADFIYFEDGAPAKTVETTFDFNQAVGKDTAKESRDFLALVEYVDDETINLTKALEKQGDIKGGTAISLQRGKVDIKVDATHELARFVVTNNTQIIVRVPDYFGEEEDDYTYLYFNGKNEIDANYKANDFQYILNDGGKYGVKGNGREFAYIFVDATHALETNRAFVLRSAGASQLKLTNGKVIGGSKYEAIVNGEEAIVVYRDENEIWRDKDVEDLLGITAGKVVPRLIRSELVLVGWTLDEVPVWTDANPIQAGDKEYVVAGVDPDAIISNGVLIYNDGTSTSKPNWDGKALADDCKIWVAEKNYDGEYTATLEDQDSFNDYNNDYGYILSGDGYIWAIDAEDELGNVDGLYDYILIVVEDANPSSTTTPIIP